MKVQMRTSPTVRLLSAAVLLLLLLSACAVPVSAAEVNLAYQPDKNGVNTLKVDASYKKSDSVPAAVFDGIKNQSGGSYKWYVPTTEAEGAWITIDLNGTYPVSSIKVYSAFSDKSTDSDQDTLTNFEVYYSVEAVSDPTDVSKFQLLVSKSGAGGLAELNVSPVQARTIKLVSKNTTSFRLREMEIYGEPGESSHFVTNIALKKQKISTYDQTNQEKLQIVTDGVTNQAYSPNIYYVSQDNADGAWINIDLEKVFLVQGVRIYSSYNDGTGGMDKLNHFDICVTPEEVADPASGTYTTAAQVRNITAGLSDTKLEEPAPVRNLKILSHNTSAFRIREIEIMGKIMPEVPTVQLLTPAEGETVGVSKPFTASAQVTKEKSEITDVRFYLNEERIDVTPSNDGAIYEIEVPGLDAGTYTLRAEVENVDGGIGKSDVVTVTVADYSLSGIRFTDGGGREISGLPANGTVKLELTLCSYTDAPLTDAFFGFALFNTETGMMEDYQTQYFGLPAGGSQTLTAKLEQLPANIAPYCVRGFFWRGTNDMRPICEPVFFGASKPVIGEISFDKDFYKNDEDIRCSVSASDPYAGMGEVTFYVDGVLADGEVTESGGVYTINLGTRYSGSYRVTAKAVNAQGTGVASAPASVNVTGYDYDPDEIVLEVLNNSFNIYVKGSLTESNQYAKYHFEHIVNSGINADLYRIFRSYAVRRTGATSFQAMYGGAPVIGEGEWEFAARETGADDFMGGFHGDEILSKVSLALDGTPVELGTPAIYRGRSVSFVQDSMLNRCDTPETDVAKHHKAYTITKDGVTLSQRIEWLASLSLDYGYVAMLPVNRKAGATQLTDKVQVLDPLGKEFDIPEKNAQTSGLEITKEQYGVKKVKAWGEESGIEVTVENQMGETLEGANFLTMVRENDNKFYFDYCHKHTTQIGEVWNNTGKYQINLTK